MHARIARFEGGDTSRMDEVIDGTRKMIDANFDSPPEGLEGAKAVWMLVDRENARGIGITLFENEEDLRRGDQALNAMSPAVEAGQSRASVEIYGSPTTGNATNASGVPGAPLPEVGVRREFNGPEALGKLLRPQERPSRGQSKAAHLNDPGRLRPHRSALAASRRRGRAPLRSARAPLRLQTIALQDRPTLLLGR